MEDSDPDLLRLSARHFTEGQDVKLTSEELEIIRRIEGGRIPDPDYDPDEVG
jgi:ribosome biogenesis protein ERB1